MFIHVGENKFVLFIDQIIRIHTTGSRSLLLKVAMVTWRDRTPDGLY